ncbi:Vacuolar protein sorting-associated protein 8-like protein [Golovinomyces cichoracearum]|uniref:Vacuolar protein sorting-associated protein 8-like protein n=1 Tax=Golovinomyces cichoracearum TaxID=62708 RepID=A0A420HPN4_9PEZI|nr:Vacuolar protein sorting-associated protein 8-like protein [Golovinomyces cichoracearum]
MSSSFSINKNDDGMEVTRSFSPSEGVRPADNITDDETSFDITGGLIDGSTFQEKDDENITSQMKKNGFGRYYTRKESDTLSQNNALLDAIPQRTLSPVDSFQSIPGDSPSVRGSAISSPDRSLNRQSSTPRLNNASPTPSFFRPFDRRFQSRLSSPSFSNIRDSYSTYFKTNSRGTSFSSKTSPDITVYEHDSSSSPWEVLRWTKLLKINQQAFSEAGKRNFGVPTCISISSSVIIGTSKGIILIFDFYQNLKSIVGPGTKAVEAGPLTSIAVSADHLVIAGGHANGSIFTWEISRAASPFLQISSLEPHQLVNRKLDGHMPNVAIQHLGFLGSRHTALVSADDHGMAFSHLASRGLGTIGRTVKSSRIIGRYPDDGSAGGRRPRNPSAILAFSPLPLGMVESASDTMGLTAILTPYLLVIVSTTPVAQTQHKIGKPKGSNTQIPLSGCLAWFPAVKLKVLDPKTGRDSSNVKLVYCWSNILTVMEVEESISLDGPTSLFFESRRHWKAEEAIVAVQWLNRSVIIVLTITQRLIVLEDDSMRVTHIFDLINKHIYHQDIFSKQLKIHIEQLNNNNPSIPTLIADAYHMSFKAYKSRIFLLGFNYISVGTFPNWADHLVATIKRDDHIGAIRLATSYYVGDIESLIIGLPEDRNSRHTLIRDKLIELMRTSLRHILGEDQRKRQTENDEQEKKLAEACIEACLLMEERDFLFEELYEWYDNGVLRYIFFKTLEPHILENRITVIPPAVVKYLVTDFMDQGLASRLEDIICHIEPSSLDIDQVTILCRQYRLYDALIYLWNRALHDYITPLIEILSILITSVQNQNYLVDKKIDENYFYDFNSLKMFPYMSYILTGRIYPTGEIMDDQEALNAKADLYWFLFSGKIVHWPKASGNIFITQPDQDDEPNFPYLRMILKFDAPSFLSVMNEAFEDSFLNDSPEQAVISDVTRGSFPEERSFGISVTRQYIITLLLEVMNPSEFSIEQMIYLDMFIARNLPKFPQYILLSNSVLQKVLMGLCHYPSKEIADDAQLSVEYLISVYHPSGLPSLLPLLHQVGFYKVLKSIYRSEKLYGKLLETYFEDIEDLNSVYDCISDCLRPHPALKKRQIEEIHDVLLTHALNLLHLDIVRTARIIDLCAPKLHKSFLDAISENLEYQYIYLRTIFEQEVSYEDESKIPSGFLEKYVQLMCKFDSSKVAAYIERIQISHLNLDRVLPYVEESGAIDAAVILMTKDGKFEEAMNRLIKYLKKLEAAFLGIFTSSIGDVQIANEKESVKNLLEAFKKYSNIGIWLCQSKNKSASRSHKLSLIEKKSILEGPQISDEVLWLSLIDISLQIIRNISSGIENLGEASINWKSQRDFILSQIRHPVQCIFSTLLTLTTSHDSSDISISFPRIIREFLTRAAVSSPHLSDLRTILASVFSAYTYEKSILQLTNRLLEKDLFTNVQTAIDSRQRGWRPRMATCLGCGRRIWGPSLVDEIYPNWEEREALNFKRRKSRSLELANSFLERGKGPALHQHTPVKLATVSNYYDDYGRRSSERSNLDAVLSEDEKREESSLCVEENMENGTDNVFEDGNNFEHQQASGNINLKGKKKNKDLGPLIVFACRHTYHQYCLEKIQGQESHAAATAALSLEGREFKCPIDE